MRCLMTKYAGRASITTPLTRAAVTNNNSKAALSRKPSLDDSHFCNRATAAVAIPQTSTRDKAWPSPQRIALLILAGLTLFGPIFTSIPFRLLSFEFAGKY